MGWQRLWQRINSPSFALLFLRIQEPYYFSRPKSRAYFKFLLISSLTNPRRLTNCHQTRSSTTDRRVING